jgi:predicted PurR-regulated permease PerM
MTLQAENERRELHERLPAPRPLLFGIGVALIAYLCWRILLPFLPAVCWALALAIIAEPMRAWLSRKSVPPSVTAVIVIVLVLTAVIGPGTLLARALVGEASDAIAATKNIWEAIERSPVLGPALRRLDSEFDLSKETLQLARAAAGWASAALSAVVARSMWLLTQIAVALFVLFYFVRDGATILSTLRQFIPLPASRVDEVSSRIAQTIRVSLGAKVLMASIQGMLGGLIFLWLGLPAPVFWGSVMAFFSLFPILGAFVVWLPAALTFVVQGQWLRAFLLAGWGVVIIHPVDNLLGPVLVGSTLRLHTLLIFFAIIGGLAAFGASGVVLGPLIVALAVALFQSRAKPIPQG